jgi:hypothetical protein
MGAWAAAARSGEAGLPAEFLAREDKADQLDPVQQSPEYLALRKELLEKKYPGADAAAAMDRLSKKLALANGRAAASSPDYAQRLGFAKQAAEIGGLYLKLDDPARALAWEKICRAIEPDNLWVTSLRNQVHEWFETQLQRAIQAQVQKDYAKRNWADARAAVRTWDGLMHGDNAVAAGMQTYSKAIAQSIAEVLRREATDGPAAAMKALQEEERQLPGLPAWAEIRRAILDDMQQSFNRAVARRDEAEARSLLEKQQAFAEQFKLGPDAFKTDENRKELDKLSTALAGKPLYRPWGQVREPYMRVETSALFGSMEFKQQGESAKSASIMPALSADLRFYIEDSPWWYGAHINGWYASASENSVSASALLLNMDALGGMRGERWSAWAGVGGGFSQVSFDGVINTDKGNGMLIGGFTVGGEYAATDKVTIFGDISYAGFGGSITSMQGRAGGRYYISHNLAVGVEGLMGSVTAKDKTVGTDIEGSFIVGGLNVLFQF